jgi:hypothetical protein
MSELNLSGPEVAWRLTSNQVGLGEHAAHESIRERRGGKPDGRIAGGF